MPIADAKQRFDILFSTLCEFQSGLLTSTSQVAGFLIVAIGWLATSSAARDFLKNNGTGRIVTILALLGTFVLYSLGCLKVYLSSQKTFRLLKHLDFVPPEYLEDRIVDIPILLIYTVGNLFLVALAVGLVFEVSGMNLR